METANSTDGEPKETRGCATAVVTDNAPPEIDQNIKADGNKAEIRWPPKKKDEETAKQGSGANGKTRQWHNNGTDQRAEEFQISWWTHEDDIRTARTTSRNYMVTKLKYAETYSVNVSHIASKESGGSKASATVYFDTAPHAPSNLKVENYQPSPQNSLIVSFEDGNQRKVTHTVTAETIGGKVDAKEETRNRKILLTGLAPGQSYCISAVAHGDNGLESERSFCDLPATTYPATPEGLDLKEEGRRLTLTWERPAIRPQKYEVRYHANGALHKDHTSDETFSLDCLKPSTTYRFQVASINNAGYSDFGEEKEHTTVPAAPVDVSVMRSEFSPESSFVVKFRDPNPQKKEYEAFAESMAGDLIGRAKTSSNSAVLNDLSPGHPYYIYVVAISGDRISEKAYFVEQK